MKIVMIRLALLSVILAGAMSTSAQNKDEAAIRAVLARQQECWNNGDLDCFMVGYWESEELKFVGGNGVTRGFAATLERYKKGYPDRAAMGTLNFDILEVDRLSKDAYSVVGKYHLTRTIGDAEGHFTLLWRKIDGEWVIVMDHSSAAQ